MSHRASAEISSFSFLFSSSSPRNETWVTAREHRFPLDLRTQFLFFFFTLRLPRLFLFFFIFVFHTLDGKKKRRIEESERKSQVSFQGNIVGESYKIIWAFSYILYLTGGYLSNIQLYTSGHLS